MQHIISTLNKPQEKGINLISEVHHSEPPPKQKYCWSQAEIEQALKESIIVQALKDNLHPMLGLSPFVKKD